MAGIIEELCRGEQTSAALYAQNEIQAGIAKDNYDNAHDARREAVMAKGYQAKGLDRVTDLELAEAGVPQPSCPSCSMQCNAARTPAESQTHGAHPPVFAVCQTQPQVVSLRRAQAPRSPRVSARRARPSVSRAPSETLAAIRP